MSLWLRLLSPLAVLLTTPAIAQVAALDAFNPENGHTYRYLWPTPGLTWDNARIVAFSQTHNGSRGHLATITSEAEQAFIETFATRINQHLWLGGFQPSGSPEPDGNWQWTTGEPFSYSNWAPWPGRPGEFLEPNDVFGEYLIEMWPTQVYEEGVAKIGTRYWNDISATQYAGSPSINRRRFLIEFTPGYAPRLNGTDLLNWQLDVGSSSRALYQRADFNGDRVVDGADLQLWRTSVPEPTAALLFVIALGLLKGVHRAGRQRRVI